MKYNKIIILFAACLTSASCLGQLEDKSQADRLDRKLMTFVSSVENPVTKTALVEDDESFRIQWNPDDVIKVFSCEDTSGSEFSIDCEQSADMMSVTFTGEIAGTSPFAAIYPAYEDAVYNVYDKSVSFVVPQAQAYAYESFANGSNPEVAYTTEGNVLKFKNLCGVLRLPLKGDVEISRIDLYDNDANAVLWGNTTANVESYTTSMSNDLDEKNHVYIDCGSTGIELSDDMVTTMHFVLPVGSLATGFKVVLTTPESATYTVLTTKPNAISRGVVRSMPVLTIAEDDLVHPYTLIDSDEHANCYIISEAGEYGFSAVKGNTDEALTDASSADVLWESFGTDIAPVAGDVIESVEYADGIVKFVTPSTLKNGNAVIAVRNSDGTILWSWHIWICEGYDPFTTKHTYAHSAGQMMDRNLGATSATPGDVHALGLLYQWGRKDPFLSVNSTATDCTEQAASTITWPAPIATSTSLDAISYSVKNPTTYITSSAESINHDWVDASTAINVAVDRWYNGEEKALYDPCPAGWHVADGGDSGVFAHAFGTTATLTGQTYYNASINGMTLPASITGATAWYPLTAITASSTGEFAQVGNTSYIAVRTPMADDGSASKAYSFRFESAGTIYPMYKGMYCAAAVPVRCQREGTGNTSNPIIPVSSIKLSKTSLSLETLATSKLTATVNPTDASNKTVTWSTSDSNVAKVSGGTVTAVGAGTATITASCDGKKATCTVTVTTSFWSYILSKYDTNKDGTMSSPEIAAVTGLTIVGSSYQFANYNGIEKLTALKTLNIGLNAVVTSLDVSNNKALTYIYAKECSKLATITVASFASMPCVLVNKTTNFVAGSTTKTLTCTTPYIVMANGSSPLCLNLTKTTGYCNTSGVPTKEQAQVLINKYSSYKNLLNASGYSGIATIDCWTCTSAGSAYQPINGAGYPYYYPYYTFNLSNGTFSSTKGYGSSSSGVSYVSGNVLKVKTI